MTPRALVCSLALLGSAMPQSVLAQDACTQIFVYAVKQFCSLLPNGQSLCQPIALTGPSPACDVPANAKFTPVPLAPPSLQMPQFPQLPFPPQIPQYQPMQPSFPYANAPVMPNPYLQNFVPGYQPAFPPMQPFAGFPVPTLPNWIPPAMAAPQWPANAWPQPPVMQAPVARQPESVVAPVTAPLVAPMVTPAEAAPAAATSPVVENASTEQAPAPTMPVTPAAMPTVAAVKTQDAAPVVTPMSEAAAPAAQNEAVAATPAATPAPSVVVEDALAHFAFDSAELTEPGRAVLDEWLAKSPVGMPVVVAGYADRLGPEPYNAHLSARRAESVREYLISKGKDKRDIRTVAKGEADPVKRCSGGSSPATKACLAPNRRVKIDPE